jgi:hypothetical protein
VLLADKAHWDFSASGVSDYNSKYFFGHKDSFCVVAQRPVPEVR